MTTWIRWFDDVGMDDVPAVGGKNASLGEMRRALTPLGQADDLRRVDDAGFNQTHLGYSRSHSLAFDL